MLGAVKLEQAIHLPDAADRDDIADQDRDPKGALDKPEEDRGAERVLEEARNPHGNNEEEPDRKRQGPDHRERPGETADLLDLVLFGDLGVGGYPHSAEAKLQGLDQSHDPAHNRKAQHPVALRPAHDRLRGDFGRAIGFLHG